MIYPLILHPILFINELARNYPLFIRNYPIPKWQKREKKAHSYCNFCKFETIKRVKEVEIRLVRDCPKGADKDSYGADDYSPPCGLVVNLLYSSKHVHRFFISLWLVVLFSIIRGGTLFTIYKYCPIFSSLFFAVSIIIANFVPVPTLMPCLWAGLKGRVSIYRKRRYLTLCAWRTGIWQFQNQSNCKATMTSMSV